MLTAHLLKTKLPLLLYVLLQCGAIRNPQGHEVNLQDTLGNASFTFL